MRLGIDTGGTFTDFALVDDKLGGVRFGKVLSTPSDPSVAVLAGADKLLAEEGLDFEALLDVIHGTTLASNVVLERRGQPCALVTTRGFRDVLLIGRQKRYDVYDLTLDKPEPLVPRRRIYEVSERVRADGGVLLEVDEDDLRACAEAMRRDGVVSVAVCFLNSYANPSHEQRARDVLTSLVPHVPVSLSSEIAPQWREYERTSSTVVNAYVQPTLRTYISQIRGELEARGFGKDLLVMQSNGGTTGGRVGEEFPVRLVESGPAAGAIMAARVGVEHGCPDVISFDMGGTTAKLCLIEGGEPTVTDAFEVDKVGLKKGSGLPISVPSIDLIEIGAGGGSIARLSSVGLLSVGPESSGAHPGPACYGRGGTEPTVTDADVALGFVNPGFFAGGSILLDRKAALTAIRQLAEPLGMDTIEAAWAIHEVVNRNMIAAARAASVERGVDPRRFSLVAFGGAGPVHCGRLAEGLGVSRVIVPVGAGVMSAQGLLTAEVKFDLARTYRTMVEDDAVEPVARVYEELARMARTMLQQSVGQDQAGEAVFARAADVRYVGQGYELRVALPGGEFGSRSFTALNAEFHRTYEAVYGRSDPEWPIEAVNWRLEARLPARHERQKAHANHTVAEQKLKERRLVYVREAGGLVETPIYDRYALAPGDEVQGPTVIEERESTIVVIPSQTAYVHENGDLVLVTRMGD